MARPIDDTPPKSQPDDESIEARWVTLEEARALDLRSPEVIEVLQYVERGGAVHPLGMLCWEGSAW